MGIDGFKFYKCSAPVKPQGVCGGLLISDMKIVDGRYVAARTFCGTCGKTPGQALDRRQLAAGEQFDEQEHYE